MRAYLVLKRLREGLNRRGARDLDDSAATATRQRRDSDWTA